jgi:transposase InsO family protein
VAQIKTAIAELPTYGYRRVHAILKRQAVAAGLKPPNHKRVYRVMKVHNLLLDRYAGGVERRHDGRIAVDERNRRWCSDGFEIGCDMAEAFVRTIKRDYVRVSPRPNAEAVLRQLPSWIANYNEVHPHKALGYRSPREFIIAHEKP